MSSTPPPVCVSVGYVSRVYASGWSSFMSVGESRGCGRAGDLASSCRVVGSVEVCRVSCESERRCRACPSAVKCNILSDNDFARTCSARPAPVRLKSPCRMPCLSLHHVVRRRRHRHFRTPCCRFGRPPRVDVAILVLPSAALVFAAAAAGQRRATSFFPVPAGSRCHAQRLVDVVSADENSTEHDDNCDDH